MSAGIKAVLFDAGNTLIHVDPQRMLDIFRDEGVEASPERFREAERRARGHLARKVEEGGSGTESHIWKEYFRNLFLWSGVPKESIEGVGRRVVSIHEDLHLWTHVAPGTRETLEALLDEGYRLAVVSNADGRVEDLLVRTGLRPYFEFVVDSFEVKVEKPDPRIFRHALDRLELAPAHCLYVGDLYPVDVVGARAAGLHALLLDPHGLADDRVERIEALTELPSYLATQR